MSFLNLFRPKKQPEPTPPPIPDWCYEYEDPRAVWDEARTGLPSGQHQRHKRRVNISNDGFMHVGDGQEMALVSDELDQQFICHLRRIAANVYLNSEKHGFWNEPRPEGTDIALMHSELSECLEAIRHGNPPSDHIPEFSFAEEELGDVIIRVLESAHARGYRVGEAMIAKMRYNEGRPFKHGKQF